MSDWSSDVGSSDLHVGSKIHLVVMGSPCAEALRGHELRVAVHQGRHREGAKNPVAAHSHVPGIGRHRPGQPDPKPARDNGRDDQLDRQEMRIRSEEHTSELPSLMRISYAVFCLKTKRNQTTT